MNVGKLWRHTQQHLIAAGLDPAPHEAKRLLAHVLGLQILEIKHEEIEINSSQKKDYQKIIQRRLQGEPVAYLTGRQPFWRHDWAVTPAVLIPRPDSEILLTAALARLPAESSAHVAEVGIGSGALLGSLLQERPHVQGTGTDLSPAALEVARQNLAELGVLPRATLGEADLLEGVCGPFDLILSNPPYLSTADYQALEEGVRAHEPELALHGGADGLALYRRLLPQARACLKPGGWLLVEHGVGQGKLLVSMFHEAGYLEVFQESDLAGRDRIVGGRFPREAPKTDRPAGMPLEESRQAP